MAVQGLTTGFPQVPLSAPEHSTASRGSASRSPGEMPFSELIRGFVNDTNQQQSAADDTVRQLVAGETDSLHDVVLTASRADLAFRLVMEIRNRLIASYQEIMRMQV